MIIDVFIVFDEHRKVIGVFTNYAKAYEYASLNRYDWYIEKYETFLKEKTR